MYESDCKKSFLFLIKLFIVLGFLPTVNASLPTDDISSAWAESNLQWIDEWIGNYPGIAQDLDLFKIKSHCGYVMRNHKFHTKLHRSRYSPELGKILEIPATLFTPEQFCAELTQCYAPIKGQQCLSSFSLGKQIKDLYQKARFTSYTQGRNLTHEFWKFKEFVSGRRNFDQQSFFRLYFLKKILESLQQQGTCSSFQDILATELGSLLIERSICSQVIDKNVTVRIRPVNIEALRLLGLHTNPTKDKYVKAKSAAHGAAQGMIPVSSRLSKLSGHTLTYNLDGSPTEQTLTWIESMRSNEFYINEVISSGKAVSNFLTQKASEASPLEYALSCIESHPTQLDTNKNILIRPPDTIESVWVSRENLMALWSKDHSAEPAPSIKELLLNYADDLKSKKLGIDCLPVEVLFYPGMAPEDFENPNYDKAIISDVDVFSISPLENKHEHLSVQSLLPGVHVPDFGKDLGIISLEEKSLFESINSHFQFLVEKLNPGITRDSLHPKQILIHHGPEQHNPYFPNFDDELVEFKPYQRFKSPFSLKKSCKVHKIITTPSTGESKISKHHLISRMNDSLKNGRVESPGLRWFYDQDYNSKGKIDFCAGETLRGLVYRNIKEQVLNPLMQASSTECTLEEGRSCNKGLIYHLKELKKEYLSLHQMLDHFDCSITSPSAASLVSRKSHDFTPENPFLFLRDLKNTFLSCHQPHKSQDIPSSFEHSMEFSRFQERISMAFNIVLEETIMTEYKSRSKALGTSSVDMFCLPDKIK